MKLLIVVALSLAVPASAYAQAPAKVASPNVTAAACGTLATMASPANGSTLSAATTFTWNPSCQGTAYWLDVGTIQGEGNIFGQNVGLATAMSVSGIPSGVAIYVRLWTKLNGTWSVNDYTYSSSTECLATMAGPLPPSTLSGAVTFSWNASTCSPSAYWLDVGTVFGQGNIFGQNVGQATTQTVTGIPAGAIIYVRLWTRVNGAWSVIDYTYPRATNCTSATMVSPLPPSTLSGTVTFAWSAGTCSPTAYWLDVGTIQGEGNVFGQNVGQATTQTVTGIPAGAIIYVRLWTRVSGVWSVNDYTYPRAANCTIATMASPLPPSTLGGTVTFTWNAATCNPSAYWLDVGTIQGEGNVFAQNVGLVTSMTVSGIPSGVSIYVRLWTQQNGTWQFNDYTYPQSPACSPAVITNPTPLTVLSGTTVNFTWCSATGAQAYWLDVGTMSGIGNVFGQNVGTATNQTVIGVPATGQPIYVQLWTQINSAWSSPSRYTYTASGPAIVNKTYGIDFSPYTHGQNPNQGSVVTPAQILSRLQIIAPYTTWVRGFGSTNGLEHFPTIARQLGLKVAASAWISNNLVANATEISNLVAAANAGFVDVAIVGSEAILRNDVSVSQLIAYINQVRAAIPNNIPVVTADVWGTFRDHPELITASDQVWANFYPYWEGTSINNALCSLIGEYQQTVALAGSKRVVISESGWPSGGNTVGSAVPSGANAALFADQFLTWANANGIPNFYFDAFDEAWKAATEGPQGATWGIFDEYGLLKPGMSAYFDGQTATVACNGLLPGSVGIAFSYVPPYGSHDTLEVRASGVYPQDYVVATYINVAGGWWTKPTFAQPTVAVNSDGTARIQIVSGGNDQNATEIAVYLIPVSCTPPQSGGGALPAVPCSVASARINRTPSSISGAVPDSQVERLPVR